MIKLHNVQKGDSPSEYKEDTFDLTKKSNMPQLMGSKRTDAEFNQRTIP